MFLLVILAIHIVFVSGEDPVVVTEYGGITGRIHELNGLQFTQFLGIPYAAPPVGDLRFKPAQRHNGWHDNNLDAFYVPPACIQHPYYHWVEVSLKRRILRHDENCLYLNIYITGHFSNFQTHLLPVIVFIHPGSFHIGSSEFEIGDAFVTTGEPVVMVTIQYRLGILGFLSSGDKILSGNLGLKDQAFALQWVRENIANFGGDPNHVTICGQSTGGESVLDHTISPLSEGLFHKAIAQSPTMAWRYRTQEIAAGYFKQYTHALNCSGDSELMVECLRSKPLHELLIFKGVDIDSLMTPIIDGEFIIDHPMKLWQNKTINDAELMVGFTSDNGQFLIDHFASDSSNELKLLSKIIEYGLLLQFSDDYFLGIDNMTSEGRGLINKEDLEVLIKGRYYDSQSEPVAKRSGIYDCARDFAFAFYSLLAADIFAKENKKVYVYVFDHRSAALRQSGPGEVELGADHGSESEYQFGYGFTHPNEVVMADEELALTRSIIHAWTTFVTGDSQYLGVDGDVLDWPEYTDSERNILRFDTHMSRDSVEDGATTWQPVLDFWLAIDNLAQFKSDDDINNFMPSTASFMTSSLLVILSTAASEIFP